MDFFNPYTNPFMAAFQQGMGQMSNIGNTVGQAFAGVNAGNQQAQLANNQTNAAFQTEANREKRKQSTVNAVLPLLSQALGSLGGGGSASASGRGGGFQATNFQQGGRVY